RSRHRLRDHVRGLLILPGATHALPRGHLRLQGRPLQGLWWQDVPVPRGGGSGPWLRPNGVDGCGLERERHWLLRTSWRGAALRLAHVQALGGSTQAAGRRIQRGGVAARHAASRRTAVTKRAADILVNGWLFPVWHLARFH